MRTKEVTYREIYKPISTSHATESTAHLVTLARKAVSIILKKNLVKQPTKAEKLPYHYWKDELMFLGYLVDYPDYWTQGVNLVELEKNLEGLYDDIQSGVLEQDI